MKKNLGATAYSINRSKGDKDFDAWKNTERAEFANKKIVNYIVSIVSLRIKRSKNQKNL